MGGGRVSEVQGGRNGKDFLCQSLGEFQMSLVRQQVELRRQGLGDCLILARVEWGGGGFQAGRALHRRGRLSTCLQGTHSLSVSGNSLLAWASHLGVAVRYCTAPLDQGDQDLWYPVSLKIVVQSAIQFIHTITFDLHGVASWGWGRLGLCVLFPFYGCGKLRLRRQGTRSGPPGPWAQARTSRPLPRLG